MKLLLWLLATWFQLVVPLNVAVIGAGICGASTSLYIRDHLGPNVTVTVFEKSGEVGGRLQSIVFINDAKAEAGASIYHRVNRHLQDFVDRFGFNTTMPYRRGRMALFSGRVEANGGFEFETSRFQFITTAKLLMRYGRGLRTLHQVIDDVIANFTRLYDIVDNGDSFASLNEVLHEVGLHDVSHMTLAEYLQEKDVPENLVNELVAGSTRMNYGQAPQYMNAFAGLVSLKGSGRKDLFSVKEGNNELIRAMLEAAEVQLWTHREVSRIARPVPGPSTNPPLPIEPKPSVVVGGRKRFAPPPPPPKPVAPKLKDEWQVYTADGAVHSYDAVLICTPLTNSGISLPAAVTQQWPDVVLEPPMWTTHATFIQGWLRPEYFGEGGDPDELPNVILTTENDTLPFSSIGRLPHLLCPLGEDASEDCPLAPIYKVFSRTPLSSAVVEQMFRNVTFQKSFIWPAYPQLRIREQLPPVVLAKGLYYANSFEFLVSTMETQTIAARNVVNLLQKDFQLPGAKEAPSRTQDEL